MMSFDLVVIENDCNRACMIFSTNFISPVKVIHEIQSLHQGILTECTEVYFDFLLCSRNSDERYAKVVCTNGILDMTQFSYVKVGKKDALRKISAQYYKDNEDQLDWTYADQIKRKLITRGIAI